MWCEMVGVVEEREVIQKTTEMPSLWKRWKRVGKKIGDIQARVLLTIFYFVVLGPFALMVRWAADPLSIKPQAARGWRLKETEGGSPIERAIRQF